MKKADRLIEIVREDIPSIQAIYFFGSYRTEDEWPESDVDVALLLPHQNATKIQTFYGTSLHQKLETLFEKKVDLVNLRTVSTVFKNEVISTGLRIYCADEHTADEFEMITFSLYQKLNEERKEVLKEAIKSGRILDI